MNDYFINVALEEAKKASKKDEIPVGCVIVKDNKIISKSHNEKENKRCSLLHAEILAIMKASKKLRTWRLDDCTMYVTLEPCMMCMGAIVESRIPVVYYGIKNNNEQMYDLNKIKKMVQIENLNNRDCAKILSDFFEKKRKK